MPFKDRLGLCSNPTAKKLFEIIEEKKTNLAIAADLASSDQLLHLAEMTGPHICVFKTHIDILEDFTPDTTRLLQKIAERHRFLLFEDRKFADIGSTVVHQYGGGIYKIASWADIVNAHILPGPGIISGLKNIGLSKGRGLLLLAEMSSKGSLTDSRYAQTAVEMAQMHSDFVIGFVAQRQLIHDPKFIHMTPGIHMEMEQDSLGQQYSSPQKAISLGADVLIVGRAIYSSLDPQREAFAYAQNAWKAYVDALA